MISDSRVATHLQQSVSDAIAAHRLADFPDIRSLADRIDTGVLVPLQLDPEPTVTMIVRAAGLRHHANEVAFPGGKRDASDPGLDSTALREAHEEIGLLPQHVHLVGRLSPVPIATSRFRLNPYVGIVSPSRGPWVPSGEIARVLDLRLEGLVDGTHEYCAMSVPWGERNYQVPVFIVDAHTRLYGASAIALLELLSVVLPCLGRSLPAPRMIG